MSEIHTQVADATAALITGALAIENQTPTDVPLPADMILLVSAAANLIRDLAESLALERGVTTSQILEYLRTEIQFGALAINLEGPEPGEEL